ncbi:TetR/AcrR family transcriptional regulator [Actinomadura rubrisoli]|uniref:TetR/AcrR family transcriptional regulator n=1 Tax=Actinomadura rubrisoli TaxID=2530368 RepID=A0A4R5AJ03_9ACTN|nr:TetR/AcrR family transcriptional regulator [Actinomadura rubrisoli]TDD70122.1 TetR/AcrR family transcriptional regulator [Actinomadura rubrisoli]
MDDAEAGRAGGGDSGGRGQGAARPAAGPEPGPGPEPGQEPELGLRERKKRETRRRISDIATGLFLARGFDNVTIADVARTADVSVNTVFNYFKTKEDLFFDRQGEHIEQAGRDLLQRRPGEGAVALFRRRFFEGLDARAYRTAFHEGSETWTKTVHDSPALLARQREIGRQAQDHLAALLAEETGAGPDDITPRAAAAMLFAAQGVLVEQIAERKRAGETLEEMRADVYAAAARVFDLLEHGLGDYAAAPAPAPGAPRAPALDPPPGK